MDCLVCGNPDASTMCPRCGTDLRLLAGESGEARLEIARVGTVQATDRRAAKRSG